MAVVIMVRTNGHKYGRQNFNSLNCQNGICFAPESIYAHSGTHLDIIRSLTIIESKSDSLKIRLDENLEVRFTYHCPIHYKKNVNLTFFCGSILPLLLGSISDTLLSLLLLVNSRK